MGQKLNMLAINDAIKEPIIKCPCGGRELFENFRKYLLIAAMKSEEMHISSINDHDHLPIFIITLLFVYCYS